VEVDLQDRRDRDKVRCHAATSARLELVIPTEFSFASNHQQQNMPASPFSFKGRTWRCRASAVDRCSVVDIIRRSANRSKKAVLAVGKERSRVSLFLGAPRHGRIKARCFLKFNSVHHDVHVVLQVWSGLRTVDSAMSCAWTPVELTPVLHYLENSSFVKVAMHDLTDRLVAIHRGSQACRFRIHRCNPLTCVLQIGIPCRNARFVTRLSKRLPVFIHLPGYPIRRRQGKVLAAFISNLRREVCSLASRVVTTTVAGLDDCHILAIYSSIPCLLTAKHTPCSTIVPSLNLRESEPRSKSINDGAQVGLKWQISVRDTVPPPL